MPGCWSGCSGSSVSSTTLTARYLLPVPSARTESRLTGAPCAGYLAHRFGRLSHPGQSHHLGHRPCPRLRTACRARADGAERSLLPAGSSRPSSPIITALAPAPSPPDSTKAASAPASSSAAAGWANTTPGDPHSPCSASPVFCFAILAPGHARGSTIRHRRASAESARLAAIAFRPTRLPARHLRLQRRPTVQFSGQHRAADVAL